MKTVKFLFLFCIMVAAMGGRSAQATSFDINLITSTMSGFTQDQLNAIDRAEAFWESVIVGRQEPLVTHTLNVDISLDSIDGARGTLASARVDPTVSFINGIYYAIMGSIIFDSSDFSMASGERFYGVVVHEVAHTIGYGILWETHGLYTPGSFQYTGAHALAEYRVEYNAPGATYIPVEDEGGRGTADVHWDHDVFGEEILTGFYSEGGGINLSRTSIASFRDLGYLVDFSAVAVPEPGTLALVSLGLLSLAGGMRRRFHGIDRSTQA